MFDFFAGIAMTFLCVAGQDPRSQYYCESTKFFGPVIFYELEIPDS